MQCFVYHYPNEDRVKIRADRLLTQSKDPVRFFRGTSEKAPEFIREILANLDIHYVVLQKNCLLVAKKPQGEWPRVLSRIQMVLAEHFSPTGALLMEAST